MGLLGNFDYLPDDPAKREAARAGLLQFGASLLGGTGNFGQMLGQGLQQGAQGYHGTLAQQQQTALRQAQMKQIGFENQKLEREVDAPNRFAKILGGAGASPAAGLPKIGDPPRPPAAQGAVAQPVPSDFQKYKTWGDMFSSAGESAQAKVYYDLADKARPKLQKQEARTVDGKRVLANIYEDGRTELVEGFAPDAEKLHFANTGGATVGLDQFSGKPVNTVRNTQSPDSVASVRVQERGQNMTQQNSREALTQKAPAGYRWTAGGELEPIPGGPVEAKPDGQKQKLADAKDVIALLDIADPLIKKGTASYAGAGLDQTARFFGNSTEGAQAAAQLKALEGSLISKMPKMSGPQSDKDVLLYKQMAGQIGDSTIPVATKQAAAKVIRELNQKYVDDNAGKRPGITPRKDLPKIDKPTGFGDAEKERRYQEWKRSQTK